MFPHLAAAPRKPFWAVPLENAPEPGARSPFAHILTDDCTADLFMKTVAERTEEAWRFVSKAYIGNVDLNEIRDFLRTGEYKLLDSFDSSQKSLGGRRRVDSILLFSRAGGAKAVLHLHMAREAGGQWKIVCMDRET